MTYFAGTTNVDIRLLEDSALRVVGENRAVIDVRRVVLEVEITPVDRDDAGPHAGDRLLRRRG